MTIQGLNMRVILASAALLALAGCGQSGGSNKASSGGGGQSTNIAEGTITDAMIDLSASESYGATSTVDESARAAAPAKDINSNKTTPKPQKSEEPKADAVKADTPSPSDPNASE